MASNSKKHNVIIWHTFLNSSIYSHLEYSSSVSLIENLKFQEIISLKKKLKKLLEQKMKYYVFLSMLFLACSSFSSFFEPENIHNRSCIPGNPATSYYSNSHFPTSNFRLPLIFSENQADTFVTTPFTQISIDSSSVVQPYLPILRIDFRHHNTPGLADLIKNELWKYTTVELLNINGENFYKYEHPLAKAFTNYECQLKYVFYSLDNHFHMFNIGIEGFFMSVAWLGTIKIYKIYNTFQENPYDLDPLYFEFFENLVDIQNRNKKKLRL